LCCKEPGSDDARHEVAIAAKDEGRFEKGKWVPGRRINGDELFQPGLPSAKIGMLKVRLFRFE